jgi:uncharacterized protein (TIGR02421 family)
VRVNTNAKFTQKEIGALIEHEIGVHMVTTLNSSQQRLKVFNLGLPVNTMTQEGLAILSEYLSGNITLDRLKKLALRVVACDMMCSDASFIDCYQTLTKDYQVDKNEAFTIVTRIFRGGGFTKDYLYLKGFTQIWSLYQKDIDLTPLLIGKTSLEYLPIINEMTSRELIKSPKWITKSFQEEFNSNPIYKYIISGLK